MIPEGSREVRAMNGRHWSVWLTVFLVVLAWSAFEPKDAVIWLLEAAPALVALVILAATYHRYPLTPLTYWLILSHSVILLVGAHYTYAEVPLFDWLGEVMGWRRNNYDKLGHLVQGFVPAIIAREILLRQRVVASRTWLAFIVICICLAISAFYELIEWWVALLSEQAAGAFLGTQGYAWDTQSDMGWALVGAVLAVTTLSGVHDRQLARLGTRRE
jgi:putative membrane protein